MEDFVINERKMIIENKCLNLDFIVFKSELVLKDKVELLIKNNNKNLDLRIILKPNSTVMINNFEINNIEKRHKFKFVLKGNAKLSFNYSLLTLNKTTIEIDNRLVNNNNHSQIKISGLCADNGSSFIKVDGADEKDSIGNVLLENIKLLTFNDENNTIIPNLFVSSNETIAIHNATIGGINQEQLVYLMSKGLSLSSSQLLIKTGFLINNLEISDETRANIKNTLLQTEVI